MKRLIQRAQSVIVYGPMGSGKTRYAQQLAAHYGKSHIVDGWGGKSIIPPDCLVLTTDYVAGAIHIADALRSAGIEQGEAA